jgi:hypothetical protein
VQVDHPVQLGEMPPAGDQHRTAGAGRQQEPDLRGGCGVVEHGQHPPVRQQRPQQARLLLRVGRELPAVDAKRA